MPSVGAIIGTVDEHRIIKYQFKTFQDNLNQYVLHDFDNPSDIIIIVRYINDPYAHVDMYNPRKISKEDKQDVILITLLHEE